MTDNELNFKGFSDAINEFLQLTGLQETELFGGAPVQPEEVTEVETPEMNALFSNLYTPEQVLRLIANNKLDVLNLGHEEPGQISVIIKAAEVLLDVGLNEID